MALHDIDTTLLRTFVTLSDTRSFSRTGGLVGRSQSAVSAQVARLEGALGVPLFLRDTRNVRLSGDGERLLPHARAMIAAADALLARFRGGELTGVVRLGAPEDYTSAYLPDVLGDFARAHRQVELHVTCRLTRHLLADFADGQADIVIIKGDPAHRVAGARVLRAEPLVWVGPPGSAGPVPGGRPLPLAMAPAPCVYRERALAALTHAHVPWVGVFTSPSFAGVAAAVRAGLGYAVMPAAMVPVGLVVMEGWPGLPAAEISLLTAARPAPAVAALVGALVGG